MVCVYLFSAHLHALFIIRALQFSIKHLIMRSNQWGVLTLFFSPRVAGNVNLVGTKWTQFSTEKSDNNAHIQGITGAWQELLWCHVAKWSGKLYHKKSNCNVTMYACFFNWIFIQFLHNSHIKAIVVTNLTLFPSACKTPILIIQFLVYSSLIIYLYFFLQFVRLRIVNLINYDSQPFLMNKKLLFFLARSSPKKVVFIYNTLLRYA